MNVNLLLHEIWIFKHPAHYKFDWAVKDDYYYNDYGQYESRYGYETKGLLATSYSGYDNKPAGHQKIEYVIYSQPIQVQSYGGYGHGGYDNTAYGGYNKGYSTGYESKSYGYDNKGYDKSYESKGFDNKGYESKGYDKSYDEQSY